MKPTTSAQQAAVYSFNHCQFVEPQLGKLCCRFVGDQHSIVLSETDGFGLVRRERCPADVLLEEILFQRATFEEPDAGVGEDDEAFAVVRAVGSDGLASDIERAAVLELIDDFRLRISEQGQRAL
jgi:hypothetical protein